MFESQITTIQDSAGQPGQRAARDPFFAMRKAAPPETCARAGLGPPSRPLGRSALAASADGALKVGKSMTTQAGTSRSLVGVGRCQTTSKLMSWSRGKLALLDAGVTWILMRVGDEIDIDSTRARLVFGVPLARSRHCLDGAVQIR